MNVKDEIIEEYKKKFRNRLMDFKFLLERKTTTLDTQIDDLEHGIDIEFYYKLIDHINSTILIQGKKTQEYLVLMLKQIKSLDDKQEDNKEKSNEKHTEGINEEQPDEKHTEENNKEPQNNNSKNYEKEVIDEIEEDL